MMRQLVGARIELAHSSGAAPRTPPRPHRACAATCAANSSGKVAGGTARAVSFHAAQDGVRARRAPECRGCRSPARAPQPPPPAAEPAAPPAPRRSPRSNRSVAYSSTPVDPGRRAVRRRAARQGSATGRTWRSRSRPARTPPRSPGSSRPTGALFCNASITWNSGWRDSERAGLSTSTSRSNGSVLVAVGRQIGRAHPRDQLAEARIARRVGAQHQRVDEEADQIVERAVGAARDRAADRDVAARAQPRQQRRKRRLQHHEQARPARRAPAPAGRDAARRRARSGTLSPR